MPVEGNQLPIHRQPGAGLRSGDAALEIGQHRKVVVGQLALHLAGWKQEYPAAPVRLTMTPEIRFCRWDRD
jgi:hypothetical protein